MGCPRVFAHPDGGAFAAVKHDGSVVTWGLPEGGGNSRHVQEQLCEGVDHVGSTHWWLCFFFARRSRHLGTLSPSSGEGKNGSSSSVQASHVLGSLRDPDTSCPNAFFNGDTMRDCTPSLAQQANTFGKHITTHAPTGRHGSWNKNRFLECALRPGCEDALCVGMCDSACRTEECAKCVCQGFANSDAAWGS